MTDRDGATAWRASDDAAASAPFIWPPRAPAGRDARADCNRAGASAESERGDEARRWSGWRSFIDELEQALLPRVADPLAHRIADGRITIDTPDVYCDRCGADVGEHEVEELGCAACAAKQLWWERFIRLGAYEGGIADAVREVKFTHFRSLGVALGRELGKSLEKAGAAGANPVIVPIPTTTGRRMELGVDHTMALARGVSKTLRAPIVRALSRRAGLTQLDVPPSQRAANVSSVFHANRRTGQLRGRTAILIDDVCTTGSTLRAAARQLRKAAKLTREQVWCAVVTVAIARNPS